MVVLFSNVLNIYEKEHVLIVRVIEIEDTYSNCTVSAGEIKIAG